VEEWSISGVKSGTPEVTGDRSLYYRDARVKAESTVSVGSALQ
jgi:hypothetical protein